MTLEDFKAVHRNDSLKQKVRELVHQLEIKSNNLVCANIAGNDEDKQYFWSEYKQMDDRAEWLYKEIVKEINRLEGTKNEKQGGGAERG